MTTVYKSLLSLNYNLMAAVDVETTGRMPGYHEIIQIGVQPLDSDFNPLDGVAPFNMNVAPEFIERAEREATTVHGLNLEELKATAPSQTRVVDMFVEWFQNLDLPFRKSLVPLAHNWAFEAGFLKAFLGMELFNECFHPHPRDSMLFCISLNDRASYRGDEIIFKQVSLTALCKQFGITNLNAHNALADAIAEAQLYRILMQLPIV
jgi:DNA polymerase III epsilon subunit-like protein